MHVNPSERYWMWAATAMLVCFTAAIVVTAVVGSTHPPSHSEMVDPSALTVSGEFSTPGVVADADGGVTVVIRAAMYEFRPFRIHVPVGRPVTFRVTSADVLHGFQIVNTNVNLTVSPGYVSEATTTFHTPGEYLVVCNEYCGLAHHLMQAAVIVEDRP